VAGVDHVITTSSWAIPAIVAIRPKIALISVPKCCDSTLPLRTRIPMRIVVSPWADGAWAYSMSLAVRSACSCKGTAGSSARTEDAGSERIATTTRIAFVLVSEAISPRAIPR